MAKMRELVKHLASVVVASEGEGHVLFVREVDCDGAADTRIQSVIISQVSPGEIETYRTNAAILILFFSPCSFGSEISGSLICAYKTGSVISYFCFDVLEKADRSDGDRYPRMWEITATGSVADAISVAIGLLPSSSLGELVAEVVMGSTDSNPWTSC